MKHTFHPSYMGTVPFVVFQPQGQLHPHSGGRPALHRIVAHMHVLHLHRSVFTLILQACSLIIKQKEYSVLSPSPWLQPADRLTLCFMRLRVHLGKH